IPIQNTVFFLQDFEYGSEESYLYEINKLGKKIFSKKVEIQAEKNRWIKQDINLEIPENLPEIGIFFITFYFSREDTLWECEGKDSYDYYENYYTNPCSYGYYSRNGRKSLLAVISDIGLLALKEKDGWNLWAYNVITGEPEAGVEIEAMEYQNLLLEKASTNRQGYARFSKENISFFLAKKGKNFSFIKVSSSSPPLEPYDLSGFYPSSIKNFNVFTYTDRGVYRPSDDIHLVAILRDEAQKPLELPLKCIFKNPLNQKILEEINSNSINGVYYFKLRTDYDAPTGLWYANLYIGEELIKSHPLRVEMIVPPKIKPEIKIEKDKIYPEDFPLPINISSTYLFGAPSSLLPYNLKLKLSSAEYSFPKYKDFFFHSIREGFSREERISEGKLNEEGKAQVQWQFKKEEGLPSFINADFILEVTEKGGRPAYDKKSLLLFPYNYYVGVKFDTKRIYRSGENIKIDYLVLDKNGNPAPGRELEVKVYFNYNYWWWEVRDIRELITSYNTELKNSFNIKSKDRPSSFDLTLSEEWGSYILEIKDINEKESIFLNIPLSYWGEGKRQAGGSFLKFEGVKENYNIGEKLSLKIKTPSEGTLFYAIAKGNKILKWEQENLKSTDTFLNINIKEEMVPSCYLFISAIQKIDQKNDLPLRSYAIIPLNVKPEKGKLELEVLCPEKVKPEQKFSVKIKILNNPQAVVTLALVDSGLINLTKEKTPDPYNHFYQKIAWDLQYRDSFDFFYPLPDLPAEYTYRIGGEGAGQKLLISPVKSNPFPPVVFFKGPFLVKGEENVEVELPNYLGEVKVIAVAAWNNSYGNHSKFVKVIDEIIPFATFPRAVAPLDEFEIPLQLFISENRKEKIKIQISSSEHFEITGENKLEVPYEKGEKMVYFYAKAKNIIGEGEISIDFKGTKKGKISGKIPVHPVNTYISKDEFFILQQNEERELKIPPFGLPGTNKASLTLSTFENIPLKSIYENISSYPFGCIEQTSSKLFATLFLRDLVILYGEIFPELSKSRLDSILEEGFRKLQGFVLPEGNFSFWPSSQNIATPWTNIYVTHILVEAEKRGFALKNFVEKALNHQKILARKKIEDPKTQAYRLYVLSLSGNPDFPSMNLLKENYLKVMDSQGKLILAASYARAGDFQTAGEILKSIQDLQKISERCEYFYANLGKYGNSLFFLSQIDREYAEKFFQKVSGALKEKGWWSTHDIGWFCAGFSSFLEKSKVISKNINVTIKYPDGKEETIEKETKIISINLNNYLSKNIKIKNNQNSPLFLNLTLSGIPQEVPEKEEYRNLRIQTKFFDENGREIDVKKLKSGDVIYEKIELQLFGSENYIALSQILPGGWEPINLRLLNLSLPPWISDPSIPSYTDIRDDRVNMFLDSPGYQGNFFFYIPIKVVTRGKFTFPPTTAQAMYNPEFYSILPQGYVSIE
ncbi:MAG: MG2 domain-containing protein, partial [Thermoanaerobaculia bacterium]